MQSLLTAIVDDDRAQVGKLLGKDTALASTSVRHDVLYDGEILHWLYVGDTALHLAAARHRAEIAGMLLGAGADSNAAQNRRRSGPLHYAADGRMTCPGWVPRRQVKTLSRLLDAGATINAQDNNGATALHRAVRTRCAAAVEYLLQAGADRTVKNNSGSTVLHLAVQPTGRGGTGLDAAKRAQQEIIEVLLTRRADLGCDFGGDVIASGGNVAIRTWWAVVAARRGSMRKPMVDDDKWHGKM